MKIAIISHTNHYTNPDGTIVGWGPTISELNHLAQHFETIYHVATLHQGEVPPSALPYTALNIKFVALQPSGGTNFYSKLQALFRAPNTIKIVRNTLKEVDAFQLRTPTGIGVYLLPYLTWFSKKKGWYKYAGNWNQKNPPLGYRFQRWFLKRQSRKVTINGRWTNQPNQCLTFENPCLTLLEREEGRKIISSKSYDKPFSFCFVGRLDDAKGVQRIIDAFAMFSDLSFIEQIHFIGNGSQKEDYINQCKDQQIPSKFHGFLPREKVFDIYKSSHFLLLPSTASEGFPKVIAEAMNFGCIPIVSNVSSIGQYINHSNGFIIAPTTAEHLNRALIESQNMAKEQLQNKGFHGYDVASSFTFHHYNHRILIEILQKSTSF